MAHFKKKKVFAITSANLLMEMSFCVLREASLFFDQHAS